MKIVVGIKVGVRCGYAEDKTVDKTFFTESVKKLILVDW